jgi:hypothetical protein
MRVVVLCSIFMQQFLATAKRIASRQPNLSSSLLCVSVEMVSGLLLKKLHLGKLN